MLHISDLVHVVYERPLIHIILSKLLYFSGQIKSIDLCLVWSHDNDDHCGENVFIELFGPNNSNSCNTTRNHDLSHEKDNLIWTDTELGNCSKVKFDMDIEELKFKIHNAEKGHSSCKDPVSENER